MDSAEINRDVYPPNSYLVHGPIILRRRVGELKLDRKPQRQMCKQLEVVRNADNYWYGAAVEERQQERNLKDQSKSAAGKGSAKSAVPHSRSQPANRRSV